MIFNEHFAIGAQYESNTGDLFRVLDVQNT